jgi:hypothetical protein
MEYRSSNLSLQVEGKLGLLLITYGSPGNKNTNAADLTSHLCSKFINLNFVQILFIGILCLT